MSLPNNINKIKAANNPLPPMPPQGRRIADFCNAKDAVLWVKLNSFQNFSMMVFPRISILTLF
jgi:hypothetical protein